MSWLLPVTLSPDWLTHVEVRERDELSRETNSDVFSSFWENSAFRMNNDITVILCVHWLWWVSRQTPSVPSDSFILSHSEQTPFSRISVWRHHTETATAEWIQSLQHIYFLLPTSCFLFPLIHSWRSWKVPAVETLNMDVVKRRKHLVWFLWWNIISVSAIWYFQPFLAPSFSF